MKPSASPVGPVVSAEQSSGEAEDQPEDGKEVDDDEEDRPNEKRVLERTHDAILDYWEAAVDEPTRIAATETFIDTGNVPEAARLSQENLDTLYAGYMHKTTVEVLDKIGLTYDEWAEHMGEEDMPGFRRDAIMGNWEALREHAKKAVVMRYEMGLPLTHKKWRGLKRAS